MTQKKLVVAYDGSPNSKNALKLGGEIAKALGAEVALVSVVDTGMSLFGFGEMDAREFEQVQQARARFGQKTVEAGGALAEEWGIPVTPVLLEGDPAEELIRYCEKEQASMIIVGPRGLSGFQSLLLGSITQKILSHSTISVIVAK